MKLIDTWSNEKQSASANSKHSGLCTESKHESRTGDTNQQQFTESISATECLNNPCSSKQPDNTTDSKKSSKSRIARWFTSLKLYAKSKKQNYSKSEKHSRGGKRRGCLHPSSQHHSVDDMSESKQGKSSESPTPDGASNRDVSSKLSTVLHRQMNENKELQSCLSVFDMVIYVPLRQARQGLSSVTDLVCDSISGCDLIFKQNLRQIVSDGSIPCLVILDGLDEWESTRYM